MRAKFSKSFKIQAVEKALSRPDDRSLLEVADSLHVSLSSMNKWIALSREQAFEPRNDVEFMSPLKEKRPQDWSLEERFQILIKSSDLAESEVSALCRKQGIHLHHLQQWQKDFISREPSRSQSQNTELKVLKQENKLLKREVHRKDKALAETAALLVLQKKVHAIWGNDEDNSL